MPAGQTTRRHVPENGREWESEGSEGRSPRPQAARLESKTGTRTPGTDGIEPSSTGTGTRTRSTDGIELRNRHGTRTGMTIPVLRRLTDSSPFASRRDPWLPLAGHRAGGAFGRLRRSPPQKLGSSGTLPHELLTFPRWCDTINQMAFPTFTWPDFKTAPEGTRFENIQTGRRGTFIRPARNSHNGAIVVWDDKPFPTRDVCSVPGSVFFVGIARDARPINDKE